MPNTNDEKKPDHSEEDTFNALKKCSFEEIDRLKTFAAEEMDIMTARITFAGKENRDKWFRKYGWTDDEYTREAIVRRILFILD